MLQYVLQYVPTDLEAEDVQVATAERLDGLEVGDDGHFQGHHQRRKEDDEEEAPAGEAEKGESVGRQRGGDQLADDDDGGHYETVPHVAGQGHLVEGLGEVAPLRARC